MRAWKMKHATSHIHDNWRMIGEWSPIEQQQFKEGIVAHGWGNWSKIAGIIVPTRNRHQVKSHGQKFRMSNPQVVDELLRRHKLIRQREAKAQLTAEGKKKSSTPPRRRASMVKTNTPALARNNSSRQPRRFSAPGNIERDCDNDKTKLQSTSAKRKSFTNNSTTTKKTTIERSLSTRSAEVVTAAAAGEQLLTSSPCMHLTPSVDDASCTSAVIPELSSLIDSASSFEFNISSHENLDHNDTLSSLAMISSFHSEPLSTFDDILNDAIAVANLGLNDDSNDALDADASTQIKCNVQITIQSVSGKSDYKDDSLIDPLLYLEINDQDLDTIFDVLRPSSFHGSTSITEQHSEMISVIHHARPDPYIMDHIRSILNAPTDYNNPTEYVLAADGVSRTGLHRGAVLRSRIQSIIGDHLKSAWWDDNGFVVNITSFHIGTGMMNSSLDTLSTRAHPGLCEENYRASREQDTIKRIGFENFVALVAVMIDEVQWYTPLDSSLISSASDIHDVRFVCCLFHDLWEHVNSSLGLDCALQDGVNNSCTLETERNLAVVSIVERLNSTGHFYQHIHTLG